MSQNRQRIHYCIFALAALAAGLGFATPAVPGAEPGAENDRSQILEKLVRTVLAQREAATIPEAERTEGAGFGEALPAEKADFPDPPDGASHHPPGEPLIVVEIPRQPRKRSTPKPQSKGGERYASNTPTAPEDPEAWYELGFSSGSFRPEPGLDSRLAIAATAKAGTGEPRVYGFVLMDEFLSAETESELNRWGVTILGPHAGAYKARLPSDVAALEAIALLPYVRWVGLSRPEQKLSTGLKTAIDDNASPSDQYPVIINLFADDRDESFRRQLAAAGAIVGSYDSELRAYTAVVSSFAIDAVVELDFVLFVELVPSGTGQHNESMPMIGIDYIRPGAAGATFDGSPIILGIMDSGFMLGTEARIMHQDLNKNGCGRNFTDDAAGVWDDEHGHGTHVLGTIVGTGTADRRFRGAAPGVGGTSSPRMRAAKVFDSNNDFEGAWVLSGMDYMDDPSDCDGESLAPDLINFSGGTDDCTLIGTDSLSRKLDGKVWTFGQLYVVSAGNEGPDSTTICSPGVAKNALTVGSVLDLRDGENTVGDVANSSSRGPTGDGRMKPNLVAPGRRVHSAMAGTTDEYDRKSGTSMAAPHVTGLAATLMHHYEEFRGRPYLARAQLMATSLLHDDDSTPSDNDGGGTRPDYGLGRVSACVAHWARENSDGWTVHRTWGTITDSQFAYRDVTVPSGAHRLVVVLTWDEPAASAGAAKAVIDDVDLWVDRGADCTADDSHPGKCGDYSSVSVKDNVEYVIIDNPPAGTYRLKATPWNVSASRPIGIAAVVVRGDTTPTIRLTARASTTRPLVKRVFSVTTSVSNPSWIASGVHLALERLPSGVELVRVTTTREDDVEMDFETATELTLGDIPEGYSRTAVWTFRATTLRTKILWFRASANNGSTHSVGLAIRPRSRFERPRPRPFPWWIPFRSIDAAKGPDHRGGGS